MLRLRKFRSSLIGLLAISIGCSPGSSVNDSAANSAPTDRDFLERCWAAVETRPGSSEFELSFEAILIPATEGGTYARSRTCPDARLGLGPIPPEDEARWERIGDSVRMPMLGAGLRGRMRVVPLERRTPYFLRVRVTSFLELEQMNARETQAFIDEHDIG